jgi:preprotein translocase subunit SecY
MRMIAALPKRLVKLFWWCAGIVAIITIFSCFILPPLAKGQIEERFSGALHRNVSIAKLGINPYAMSLTVNGFTMHEQTGTETAASFEEL